MRTTNLSIQLRSLILLGLVVTLFSCEKDEHNPPDVSFKTDAGYTFSDKTVNKGDTLKVGIVAKKTEDELNTFNVSKSYDNASSTTTHSNEAISGGERNGFSKDVKVVTRNQSGAERWVFTVTDADGNIKSLTLNLTVQ